MGWSLSSWLILVRLVQLLGSFIPAAMNGWLVYDIYTNRLGLTGVMVIVEVLIDIIFIYTAISLLVIHTGQRSTRTPWLFYSICFDVLFIVLDIAIISMLAYGGLPSNCGGLTSSEFKKGDNFTLPAHGYTTIRFSNEQDGHRGELDRYCGMERGFYFVAVAIVLTYVATIMLSVIRICNNKYTFQQHLDEEAIRLQLKMENQEAHSRPNSLPTSASNSPSALCTVTTAPQDNRGGEAAHNHSASQQLTAPSSSRMPMARPLFANTNSLGVVPGSSSYQPPLAHTTSNSTLAVNHHASSPYGPTSPTMSPESASLLSSTEMHANLAMITDGSRYSNTQAAYNNQLPPYSPGNLRPMNGHGDESNEIRLSEYVKGATRAQDMKDSGAF